MTSDQIKELRDRIEMNITSGTDCKAKLFTISEVRALLDHISQLEQRVAQSEKVLNPRQWTDAMDYAWHTNIPDMYKAFEELRIAVGLQDKGKEE